MDVVNKEQRSALHELCRSPTEHYMCKAETEVDEDDSSIVSLPSPVTTPIDTESSPKDAGVSADADALPDSELSPTDGTKSITTTGRAPRPTMEERRAERERKEVKARERKEKLKAMEPALLERREEELAEITCLLLEAGCQPDRRSQSYGEEDFTPLLYAAFHNHAQIALVLTQVALPFIFEIALVSCRASCLGMRDIRTEFALFLWLMLASNFLFSSKKKTWT